MKKRYRNHTISSLIRCRETILKNTRRIIEKLEDEFKLKDDDEKLFLSQVYYSYDLLKDNLCTVAPITELASKDFKKYSIPHMYSYAYITPLLLEDYDFQFIIAAFNKSTGKYSILFRGKI